MKPHGIASLVVLLILCSGACGIATAQTLSVEDLGTVTAGETVVINGTTNLAPGNQLLVTVIPTELLPLERNRTVEPTGISGTVTVESGDPRNTWSFTVNTGDLEPGNYLVTVEWIEGDATATTTLTVAAATPSPATVMTTAPTTAATTATPSPTPTQAAPAMPVFAVLVASLAAALLLRR